MSLDRLVEEIRARGAAEQSKILAKTQAELAQIAEERDRRVVELTTVTERTAAIEATREKTQRVAAAKLRSRQRLYEAREARLKQSLGETRELLARFVQSPEYPQVLERMYRLAQQELGSNVRVRGRSEDSTVLKRIASKAFVAEPEPIVGGLVAESPDGLRQLDLSFNELLRLREDRVRELLA
ncbi:MAG: V-type ATP synthase subunit E [Thermoplasmata archaeon]